MKRCLLAVLLATGGCDRAFGLTRDADPPICGPYGAPVAVPFDAALKAAGAHDFSVDATGKLGMVNANLSSGLLPAWRGPHAIKLTDRGEWTQDLARDKDVLDSLDGAHIEYLGTKAIGWTDVSKGATLREYDFASVVMKWSLVPDEIEGQSTFSPHAGNMIVSTDGFLRTLTEILVAENEPFVNVLQIYQKLPTTSWMLTPQANLLFSAKPKLNISGAVLTSAHDRMVYTANVGNEKDDDKAIHRIFAGQREDDIFTPGVELVIDGTESDVSFSEPWINDDCTTLYYRQNEVTWTTTQVSQ